MADYKKIDDNTIERIRVSQPETIKTNFTREFVDSQIKAVENQKAEQMAARDAELAELYEIRDGMDKLGIVSKPVTTEG